MSITNAQFAKLADYYGFDIVEARKILDLLKPKSGGEKKVTAKPKVTEKPKVTQKRGATGYQAFLKYYHPIAKAKMQSNIATGEKLAPSAVVNHISSEWKVLSESKR